MRKFWKKQQDALDIEAELRASRPEPRDEFVHGVASRLSVDRASRGFARVRVAFAAGLATVLLVALATTGGLGYAASAGKNAAEAVKNAVAPPKTAGQAKGKKVDRVTPAQAQYKVTICHRTGSAKHRWVAINVSSRALAAHMRHVDFIVTPTRTCPPR